MRQELPTDTKYVNVRRTFKWSVLTALWFTMVSTCTRVSLAVKGASDPANCYHGWYTFFVSFSLISAVVSMLVVAVGIILIWRTRRTRS